VAELTVNCAAPLRLTRWYLPAMLERGRGAVVFMSSMAALSGMPRLAGYAATKGHLAALSDSLWAEVQGSGVDVLGVFPGATDTPGLRGTEPDLSVPVPVYRPAQVVAEALSALGRTPRVIPGAASRVGAAILFQLLPRSVALRFNAAVSRRLYRRDR